MFADVKKGDTVLITERVNVPGSHSFSVYRRISVDRVYQHTFVVAGAKFYKRNGEYAGDNRFERRHVRPLGQQWTEKTAEDECQLNKNINSLNLVMEVAKKLEHRNNVNLVRDTEACDFIKTAVLEINKLLSENK